jgi:hypothetical protein
VSSLEAGIVLHAEAREGRYLAAPQSGDPAATSGREPDLLRGEAAPASCEELAHLLAHVIAVVHAFETKPLRDPRGAAKDVLSVHPSTVTSSRSHQRLDSGRQGRDQRGPKIIESTDAITL